MMRVFVSNGEKAMGFYATLQRGRRYSAGETVKEGWFVCDRERDLLFSLDVSPDVDGHSCKNRLFFLC